MSERIAREKLESYLWDSALLLRDHMDAGSYKQYIFPLLFFKRLSDVYEEDAAKAARESEPEAAARKKIPRLSLPDDAHWDSIRNVPQDVGKAIQTAFQAVEKANPKMLRGIFGDGTWANKRRLPDRLLKDLIEHFSTLTLSVDNCPEDDLGRAFDYLIKKIAESSGHTAQEFYTNRTVAQLMVQLLKLLPLQPPREAEILSNVPPFTVSLDLNSIEYWEPVNVPPFITTELTFLSTSSAIPFVLEVFIAERSQLIVPPSP